jgi:hypothetical protein
MRHARNTCNLLILFLAALLLVSCTFLKREPPIGEEPVATQPASDVSYDPLGLPQDTLIVTATELAIARPDTLLTRKSDSTVVSSGESRISGESAPGIDIASSQVFRVQLLTANTFGDGRRALAVAEEIFDQPVVLDYEVPYYKLRVGQFASRPAAESYLQRTRTAGYENAIVAICMIGVREATPVYDQAAGSDKSQQPQGDGSNARHK